MRHFQFSFFSLLLLFALACQQTGHKIQTTEEENSDLAGNTCINSIIALDDSLGTIRNHACEMVSLSETIQQYTTEMAKFDFQNCPGSFVTSFNKHRKAWLGILQVTDKYPELRGELHDLFDEIHASQDSTLFDTLLKDVWDTWAEVEEAMNE